LNKETHKIFDSQKSTLTPCKNHTYTPEIISGKQLEAKKQPNLMVTLPSQPYMCSSIYLQAKLPQRSTKIFNQHIVAVYYGEREFSSDESQHI